MGKVLKDGFRFSSDGFTMNVYAAGDDIECGACTQGLVDDGYIEAEGFKPTPKKKKSED